MIEDNEIKTEEVKEEKPSWQPADDEERKALSNGWIPPHEYKGDPKYYKNAYLYNKEGELYSYISSSNKKLNEFEKALQTLNERNKQIAEESYKRGLEENARRMREAAAIGDVKAIDTLRNELVDLSKPYMAPTQTPEQSKLQYEQERKSAEASFKLRNPWFDVTKVENLELIKAAREIDQVLAVGNLTPEKHFELLEKHVKAKFPEKFNSTLVVAPDNGVSLGAKEKLPDDDKLPKEFQLELQRMRSKLGKKFDSTFYKQQLKECGLI